MISLPSKSKKNIMVNKIYDKSPNSLRYYFLDNLRGLAIIMVICIHVIAYNPPFNMTLNKIILFVVSRIAVPIFFFADGYLFSKQHNNKKINYINYIEKSFKRLILPWFIISLFYFSLRYFVEYIGMVEGKFLVNQSVKSIIYALYGSQISMQLYFLLSLFIVRLIGPIQLLIKNKFIILIAFLAFTCIIRYYDDQLNSFFNITGGIDPLFAAIVGFQYYLFGICIEKYELLIKYSRQILFFLLIIFTFIMVNYYSNVIVIALVDYIYLLFVFLFFNEYLTGINILTYIGSRTMGIYILHEPLILKVLSIIILNVFLNPIVSYFVLVVSVLVCSIIFNNLLRKNPIGKIILH